MSVITNNKKAFFDYYIEDKFICGMRLKGTEVKSIKEKNCSIKEAYCYIKFREVWIRGMFIKEYMAGSYNNHEEVHDRKLLLTKKEIIKLERLIDQKGFTILPLKVLLVNGYIKMEIGVGKGKKLYDKRNTIKERDLERDLNKNEQ